MEPGITFFCEDKLNELQISVVGELSSAISLIFDEMCGEFTFSWNFGSWFRIMKARYKDVQQEIVFEGWESIQHTSNVYIWFFFNLTLFWNNYVYLTIFLVIIIQVQSANCGSYCLTRIKCDVRELKQQRRRRIRKRYLTAKKYTKKRDARAKLLFCYSKPISFLTFSLSPQPSTKSKMVAKKRLLLGNLNFDLQSENYRLFLLSCIFVMLNSQRLRLDMSRLKWAINPNFRISAETKLNMKIL